MRTHPVFLRLEGRRCVIIGGDAAAAAKASACRRAGGSVVVIAPALDAASAAAVAEGGITHLARAYRARDLAGAFLAYASTRDPEVIGRLAAEADREGVLLNVIDVPEACSFVSPAVLERGELVVAVGTGGASPGLAARLRSELASHVGPEYGPFLEILGAVRRRLGGDPARGDIMSALLASPLLELVRHGRRDDIDALLGRVAGFDLDRLGVALGGSA